MELISHSRHSKISLLLSSFINRVFQNALDRFASKLARVRIVLEDVNGPKGGNDQRCKAILEPKKGAAIVVSTLASTPFEAVLKTAQRAKVVLSRKSKRQKVRLPRKPTSDLE